MKKPRSLKPKREAESSWYTYCTGPALDFGVFLSYNVFLITKIQFISVLCYISAENTLSETFWVKTFCKHIKVKRATLWCSEPQYELLIFMRLFVSLSTLFCSMPWLNLSKPFFLFSLDLSYFSVSCLYYIPSWEQILHKWFNPLWIMLSAGPPGCKPYFLFLMRCAFRF